MFANNALLGAIFNRIHIFPTRSSLRLISLNLVSTSVPTEMSLETVPWELGTITISARHVLRVLSDALIKKHFCDIYDLFSA